jgi:hypothetical protein
LYFSNDIYLAVVLRSQFMHNFFNFLLFIDKY